MPPRRRNDDVDYKYMQLIDASSSINQRVNLIGIVIETTLPKRTKGTDLSCSLKIVDETQPTTLSIMFFAETAEKLPRVASNGDIILVSQVTISSRGSEVYAMYNKKFSSFALYEGRDIGEKEFASYQYSRKFSFREQDKRLITGMREWLMHNKIEGLNDVMLLREIKKGERLNLLCKIIHVQKVKKDKWILFFWDGTDAPPACIETKLEDEMENPLPLHLEASPLSRDILCTFPTVGTVMRMIIDQSYRISVNNIYTNRWVKFVNIKCEVVAGLWQGELMPYSALRILSDDDDRVLDCERTYNLRVPSKWARMPFTSFPWPSHITETDHPDVPVVTLMNVLTHAEVTCKFKCVVRVVAIFPWRADDFRSPCGIFRIRLTLEDPTARIHAFLYAEDGIKFFGNDFSADMLARKRNMLLGIEGDDFEHTLKNVSINPPWVECCLKSYYLDKNDAWGSRNYRIFGTTLVC
ncbi:protection of telomeres protein 1b-like [Dorcoceras hygrometricum]|uniref:Protection of telomeres protein 1b-like n=1 Tax=Dorcoceras hygrometricum TaxID=472368 RepID=A0A2Z7C499_9LAMI|nr:protection of telomeres protein 1b-like [Dorcoceras hygrometricum]